MKKMLTLISCLMLFVGAFALTENYEREKKKHPKIAKAITSIQDAIDYLTRSADDFGGHKDKALGALRDAEKELTEALEYRAEQDNKEKMH